MTIIQNYASGALLSDAAYADFPVPQGDYKSALERRGFTADQAADFLDKYDIAYHYPNDETGLSFTVFRAKFDDNGNPTANGKLTLAIRGTDGLNELPSLYDLTDDLIAVNQTVALNYYINALYGFDTLSSTTKINLMGHSLGGNLAQAVAYLQPVDRINNVYTYNAAKVNIANLHNYAIVVGL